jgi:O-antigen ligase
LEIIERSPLLGEGFGGYWALVTPGLGTVTQSPHNLYIQTLVKIGMIGLVIYLVLIVQTYRQFRQTLKRRSGQPHHAVFLTIGLMTLVASHFYFVAYAFDHYSLFFVGMALATTLEDHHTVAPRRSK